MFGSSSWDSLLISSDSMTLLGKVGSGEYGNEKAIKVIENAKRASLNETMRSILSWFVSNR
jgi:hypothetical protein